MEYNVTGGGPITVFKIRFNKQSVRGIQCNSMCTTTKYIYNTPNSNIYIIHQTQSLNSDTDGSFFFLKTFFVVFTSFELLLFLLCLSVDCYLCAGGG